MRILAAIGIRALIEAVCSEEDAGGRNLEKIDSLVEKGGLTKTGADIRHSVRFMGNATADETKRHDLKTLGTAFDVAENLLQDVYILPDRAAQLNKTRKSRH